MARWSRRAVLGGTAGVALALPWLEGLRARADQDPPPRRFVAFIEPNGVNVDRFWPTGEFGTLTAGQLEGGSLSPLSAFASRMTVPRGLRGVPDEGALFGNSHMRGLGRVLTAQPLLEQSKYAAGISLDQHLAARVNPGGKAALNIHVGERTHNVMDHCSYFGSDQPAPPENDPWVLYQDLVGLSELDADALARTLARRESVLDLVSEEYEQLLARDLSADDRSKLDMHFTHVRALETTLEEEGLVPCGLPEERVAMLESLDPETVGHDENFGVVGSLLSDVMVMALACGRTRVATLQWGAAAGGPVYAFLDASHQHDHHFLSHGTTTMDEGGEELTGYRERLFEIDHFLAQRFAELLARLDAYVEGDGTLLDHCVVAWMNELSDGRTHDHRDLPVVLAGSCGGSLRTGQYLDVREAGTDVPHNRLLTTLEQAMGGELNHFGAASLPSGAIESLLT